MECDVLKGGTSLFTGLSKPDVLQIETNTNRSASCAQNIAQWHGYHLREVSSTQDRTAMLYRRRDPPAR